MSGGLDLSAWQADESYNIKVANKNIPCRCY